MLYPSFVFLFFILSLAINVVAQETPTPPPRAVERTAPEREPVILQRTTLPDGSVRTVIELPATADSYLASERPNQNFGGDALFLGYNLFGANNFGAERIVIQFDVAGNIPDGAVINDAALRLHISFSSPPDDEPMGTALRRLASPWSEYTVTWNTEPTWTAIDKVSYVGSAVTWHEWVITEVVDGWAGDVYPNYGVEIIGDETVQQRERAFYSRETGTALFPRLVVDYTDFNDTEPPIVNVNALPEYVRRNFTVSWTGTDPGGSSIATYDVQVRIDDGDWTTWLSGVTFTEAEYNNAEDGSVYQFRARGVDQAGNVEPYGPAEAETTADTVAPTSTIDPLPVITNNVSFTVSWTGTDTVSGIKYYDVQYRYSDGPWLIWLPQTIATSATFTSGGDGLYQFEVRAVDQVNQVEAFMDQANTSPRGRISPPLLHLTPLPRYHRTSPPFCPYPPSCCPRSASRQLCWHATAITLSLHLPRNRTKKCLEFRQMLYN